MYQHVDHVNFVYNKRDLVHSLSKLTYCVMTVKVGQVLRCAPFII